MHEQTLIRRARKDDQAIVTELAVINNMFAPDELAGLTEMFLGALDGDLRGHQWFVATTPEGRVIAAAYLAPEPFADGLWNLYFIATHPSEHGTGTALIEHVETLLRDAGEAEARVLIVETSSTDQYAATRAFYLHRGFDEEARIRDFYGPGDHKVVLWKALTS